MWFAGEPVAYYYGGHLVAAIPTKINRTAGHYAYNLALAGLRSARHRGLRAGGLRRRRPWNLRRAAGAFGAFFVGIASNLSTPVKFLVWLLPDGPANWLAETSGLPVEGFRRRRSLGLWLLGRQPGHRGRRRRLRRLRSPTPPSSSTSSPSSRGSTATCTPT